MYIDDETKFIQVRIYKEKKRIVQQHNEEQNTVADEEKKNLRKIQKENCLEIFHNDKLQDLCRSFTERSKKNTD